MKFAYTQYELPNGSVVSRPDLPINFRYKQKSIPVQNALVDTGADQTLLPLDFAIHFGWKFDLTKDGEEWHGAGGGTFRVFPSPEPIQFAIDQRGFPSIRWSGFVYFTLQQPTILLGHKGCLEHLIITFRGKEKVFDVESAH